MAFARMARWADDLTLLLAPGVKLIMRKSQNLEVQEVTYRLFLEHGGGLYEKKTERQQFSRVVTDSRRCLLPHHRAVEPREMPRKLRIVAACHFRTFWAADSPTPCCPRHNCYPCL